MAVAFDAVGPSATGATGSATPLTWTHVCGASATHLLVGATWDGSPDGGGSMSATYNSVAMTSLGVWHTGGATAGFLQVWALAAPTAGSHSVAITFAGSPAGVNAGSISFTGSAALSAVQSNVSSGASANPTLTFAGSTTGSIVAAFVGAGTTVVQAGSFTQRYNTTSGSGSAGAGFTAGATLAGTGGSVTANWTMTADDWAVVGVEVRGAVIGGFIPVPLPQLPPTWFPGADRVIAQPGGVPFALEPGTTDATPAVIIPPFPEPAPLRPPLLPPTWFPGADAVTAVPGGIPFSPEPGTTDATPAVIFPVPEVAGIVDWLPWPPNYFPGSQAVAVDPGGIPFYSQPQPLTPPPAPLGPPVITGLAGGGTGYFADQYGNPRLVWGDAPWALPGNAGRWNGGNWRADFDGYVSARAAQGCTVIYTKPMGTTQSGNLDDKGSTFDALYPFQGGTPSTGVSNANPSTGLTAAFWARIDYFLSSAAASGITVFLNAIGYDSDFETLGPLAGKSAAEFQAYGAALGGRYAATANLVWMVADDYFGGADTNIAAFLTGLRGAGDTHVIAIENMPESDSRFDLGNSTVLAWGTAHAQFNFVYTYAPYYLGVEYAYAEASPVPVIGGDGYFYQNTSSYFASYDRGFRQDAWWALSSGARGAIHGDEGIWQWASTALAATSANWFWANSSKAIAAAFTSLPGWHLLIPDRASALVTSGRGTRGTPFASGGGGGTYEPAFTDTYVSASRVPDGSLAVIYMSHATTIGIDQSKMAPGYTATWIDPVSGAKTAATPGASYNSAANGNNSAGDPDWVLALQGTPATAPPSAPVLAPPIPLPPTWFPGADAVTAQPGGLPFYVQPEPDPGVAQTAGTTVATATLAAAGAVSALVTEAPIATVTGAGAVTGVVVQDAGTSTSLAGAGAVSALVTEVAGASVAGAGGVGDVATQAAAATLAGAGAITDVVTQIVTATITGAGVVTASAIGGSASASIAGAGAVTALATQIVTATAAGAGTVAATPTQGATAALTGAGSVNASGQITGTANLAAAGALTATAAQAVTAAPVGAGSVSALVVQAATASPAGAGAVTAATTTAAAFTVGTLTGSAAPASGVAGSTAPSSTVTGSAQRTGGSS